MRWVVGDRAITGCAASASQMGRFETEWLALTENLATLADLPGQWIDKVHQQRPPKSIVLDMDSSAAGWRDVLEPVVVRYRGMRLQLHALAYNLGNFMRTLAMPKTAEPWSLTSMREKLIKIGANVVNHGRYVTFQMAEVAVPRQMFQEILSLIAGLRAPPAPA
jgi:hypothetical protein